MNKKRGISTGAKIVIGVLVVIVLVLAYLNFVDGPINERMEDAQARQETIAQECGAANLKLEQMRVMQEELQERKQSGLYFMPSYNSVKHEISILNSIFKKTKDYSISLSDPVMQGNQMIRRDVDLRFTTKDYAKAIDIVKKINACGVRNTIQNVNCTNSENEDGYSSITLKITFYETIFEGKPDSGLIVMADESAEATDTITE